MSIIRIDHNDPAFANRPRVAYINCGEIFEVSDNYDKEGRLLSKNAKVTMKSGKTYIVNESVTSLVTRIGQECPAPANIAGPQGQQGIQGLPGASTLPISGTVYAQSYTPVQEFMHAVYLTSGTLSNTSAAYMRVTKVIGQNSQDNLLNVTGTMVFTNPQNSIVFGMRLITDQLIVNLNGIPEIEGSTTEFFGDGQVLNATASIPADGWYNMYIYANGSVSTGVPAYTNGCIATVLGMTLHYL